MRKIFYNEKISALCSQLSCDDVYTSIQCKITPQTTPWVWNGEILFAFHITPILHVLCVVQVKVQKDLRRSKIILKFLTFFCDRKILKFTPQEIFSSLTSNLNFILSPDFISGKEKIQTIIWYRTRQFVAWDCQTFPLQQLHDIVINFIKGKTFSDSFLLSFNTQLRLLTSNLSLSKYYR
jgi:hypothetical protein